jgi:urocanate hydratase
MRTHVEAMVDFWNAGVPTLDYGNNIRQVAKEEGLRTPSPSPASCRPISARCSARGIGPFRWCALSGDPEDIYKTDAAMKRLFPENAHLHRWLDMARERIAFQGLPARICWIGLGDRHRAGLMFNEMVASGRAEGADRDRARPSRFRLGRLAEPRDRGDEGRLGRGVGLAAAERAAEHRLGRDLGQLHHGGGVGMGFSQHAGMVIVADGTPRRRAAGAGAVERPGLGRLAPCGCGLRDAIQCAKDHGLRLPGILGN